MTQKTTLDEQTSAAVCAKITAKKRWHALQPTGEVASPVCYLDEASVVPDLETFMNLAAMRALSGLTTEQLARLEVDQPQRYWELLEQAKAVPCTYPESEGGNVSS